MSVKIKVCGLKDEENISSLLELIPDYLGFILVADSKRYVKPENLENLLRKQEVSEKAVLVLRNMPLEKVLELPLGLIKGLQLHGSEEFETPEYVMEIKRHFPALLIFKVIGVSSDKSFEPCDVYQKCVDYFLFDTKLLTTEGEVSGGLGKTFNWGLLPQYKLDKPYMLSGGLSLENLNTVLELAKSDKRLVGVDLNSRFELEPGIKNIDALIKSFKLLRG